MKKTILFLLVCTLATFANAQDPLMVWPLSNGRVWTYHCQDALTNEWTETREVIGSTTIGGEIYYHVHLIEGPPGDITEFYVYARSTDYSIIASDGVEIGEMDYVIAPVGFTLIPGVNRIRELVAIESITVPYGGPYQAYSYGKHATDEPLLPSPFMIESFVPGLGFIKIVDHWRNNPPVIKELVSITPDNLCGDYACPYPEGDMDHDCVVRLGDLVILAQHWMECTISVCD